MSCCPIASELAGQLKPLPAALRRSSIRLRPVGRDHDSGKRRAGADDLRLERLFALELIEQRALAALAWASVRECPLTRVGHDS
jgi:hypothetical protein